MPDYLRVADLAHVPDAVINAYMPSHPQPSVSRDAVGICLEILRDLQMIKWFAGIIVAGVVSCAAAITLSDEIRWRAEIGSTGPLGRSRASVGAIC